MDWLVLQVVPGIPATSVLAVVVLLLALSVSKLRGDGSLTASTSIVVRRPGWIAHWRAARGVVHPKDGVAVGFQAALGCVTLSARELVRHGVVWGATGVGKTTLLALLAQGFARIGAVIILDGKGNSGPGSMQAAIRAAGGLVWTIGGGLKLDLLDTDPTVLAEQLTEAARHEGPSEVFTEAAARALQWIGYVLRWRHQTPTLERVEALLQPGKLAAALQDFKSEPRVRIWLEELSELSDVELSGMATALMRVTRLLDSEAGRSLGTGADAIRLEDVVQTNSLLLVSANSRRYPGVARIMGGWALVAMQRACESVPPGRRVLLVVDEVASFQGMAKHLEPLLATARDAGVGVVVAAHGPSELEGAHRGLATQVLSLVTWQIMMRVGDTTDADRLSTYFPLSTDERITLGTHAQGVPSVTRDRLIGLGVGNCLYHVAPTTHRDGIRWGAARIAQPRQPGVMSLEFVSAAETATELHESDLTETFTGSTELAELAPDHEAGWGPIEKRVDEVKRLVYAQIRTDSGYRTWQGAVETKVENGKRIEKYPRIWIAQSDWHGKLKKWVGKWHAVHRLVCEWEQGEIPKGWTVDHECGLKRCLDHLGACTRPENTKRERERERGERPTGHPVPTPQPLEESLPVEPTTTTTETAMFAVALFSRVDRPTVEQKAVSLDELRRLLSRFQVLDDKRRGRCWSPTKYADGASSRGNVGVEAVSCLVFDLDRVPPDPKRLEGVYWLGHTTHSHTPQAPRWRVIIPLSEPVPAAQWGDVWRRARAALCPEADPQCKDASRAYWLPSHNGGVSAKATCHDGPLLDVAVLPELPVERRPRFTPRSIVVGDDTRNQAYMCKVLDNLATLATGGRNAALNHAAWTLGHWVAAGALGQAEAEDGLYAAAERNGLVEEDGGRQCWATIRSGLNAGLLEPLAPDADR